MCIYRDAMGGYDQDGCPEARKGEMCLNCGKEWRSHHGWFCGARAPGNETRFSKLPSHKRYLTKSMADSISQAKGGPKVMPDASPDITKWQTWRDHGLQPGECVCKCPRDRCPYHRD